MAKLLKLRRGSTSAHASFTGAEGEVTIDTTKDTAVVHDGSQAGGRPLAREDMTNVSSASIAGQLGTDSIAVEKIAAGTLPSDVKINSANINDGQIVNADIYASAAIAGTKISPNFGSQNIITSGTVDGRDVSADGTKLDGIESGATADQTAAEIRTLVGSASDSNVFTDADHSKLDGIESGATGDQTAAEILTAIKTVDGSGSGLDADTLDGMNASSGTSGNTIVQRNASGYVFANYFNTSPNDVSSGITKVCVETSNDGYIRHGTAAGVRTFLNVENGATADQTASEILTLIKTVDGSGSGLDADTLDGVTSGSFVRNNNGAQSIAGNLTVGTGTASYIYMVDSDHGNRSIHNNSNQIGFLKQDGNWGAYCDDNGNWTAAGNVTAYSDSRLKTDISTINDALGIVGKLRGVSYKWLRDGSDGIGVIAQEVEEILPSVVVTNKVAGLDGMEEVKSVDYGKIVGVLINAINELKAEVDELKGGK